MLEKLNLYKKHLDLMYYSYNLLIKYPKVEKNNIVTDIKSCLFTILRCIISYYENKNIYNLKNILIEIKVLLVLIRISYKMKYISNKNYLAFSRKITIMNNITIGLIKYENNKK